MNTTVPITKSSSLRRAADNLAEFRLIPRIETYPAVVSFAQTLPGKVVLLAACGLGLRFFLPDLISVLTLMLPLALITFMPEYRRFVLAVSPVVLVVMKSNHEPLLLGVTLTVIALGAFLYWCVMRWPKSRFGKRPLAFLLTSFTILILLAGSAGPQSFTYKMLWTWVGVMSGYVWFIGFALTDRNSKPAEDLTLELTTFRPVWSATNTPLPKGAAYLRRIEAKNPEQLAIAQLKGIKLLLWAILLALLQISWNRFFHGYLRIQTSAEALAMSVRGTPVAWHVRWESQILAFFEIILSFSIWGHRSIALCRMMQFSALRNTYRPLSSTSIAEFFNRFYYYFKELLVDIFFLPCLLALTGKDIEAAPHGLLNFCGRVCRKWFLSLHTRLADYPRSWPLESRCELPDNVLLQRGSNNPRTVRFSTAKARAETTCVLRRHVIPTFLVCVRFTAF